MNKFSFRLNVPIIGLLIFFLVAITNIYAGEPEKLSKIILHGTRDNIELWDMLVNQGISKNAKQKLATTITSDVILIRSASPDIDKLEGNAVETLCLLNQNDLIFNFAKEPLLAELATQYLSEISDSVINRIKASQRTMKGEGCYITPE